MRTLVVTVGGSHQPIVTAIGALKPDRVVFICSTGRHGSRSQVDGPGKPCKVFGDGGAVQELPNLVTQVALQERFDIIEVDDPDDIMECYEKVAGGLQKLASDGAEVQVDYTGGTKTMSLALGAAALDLGLDLHVTSRQRTNLQKVDFGEYTARMGTSPIRVERTLRWWVPDLLAHYDYAGAMQLVEQTLAAAQVPARDRRRLQAVLDLVTGLDAWDRFDHQEARRRLELHKRHPRVRALMARLDRLIKARESASYVLVEDLLLNADRRAHQRRYDDAVGRLYRALELMAQTRLESAHSIRTGAVEEGQIPETVRAGFLDGSGPERPLKLGLVKAYELLKGFPEDPLGQLYTPVSGHLLNQLEVRNNSLLAHGLTPVDRKRYEAFHAVAGRFLEQALQTVSGSEERAGQLPTDLDGLVGE